jgi:LacI family transcriptional regulator
MRLTPAFRRLTTASIFAHATSTSAAKFRIGQSSSVGLIVPDVSYPFFTDLARGAEAEAAELGLSVFLGNSDIDHDKEVGLVRSFLQQRVRGLLVAPITSP